LKFALLFLLLLLLPLPLAPSKEFPKLSFLPRWRFVPLAIFV